MSWHKRYKAMKKVLGYTNSDIAKITGNTTDSIKSTTQPNKSLPRWLRLAITVFERYQQKIEPNEKYMKRKTNEL